MSNELVDIIIPVHNGEKFIEETLAAAINVSDTIGCGIIVSSNACTDKTNQIISKINHRSLQKVYTSHLLSAAENYFNCLLSSAAEYVVLCGADDLLDAAGQKQLMKFARRNRIKPSIIFGYDEVIDINGKVRRSHKNKNYWCNLTQEKIIKNSFGGYNPNLNGAWVNRLLAIECYNENRKKFTDPLSKFQRISDLILWNCFARQVLFSVGALGFHYFPVRQVLYREYFEHELSAKGDMTIKVSQNGRSAFLEYIGSVYNYLPAVQKKNASYGIKRYSRNNFLIIFSSGIDEVTIRLFKKIDLNGNLFLTEKLALLFIQKRYFSSIVLALYNARRAISLVMNRIRLKLDV